MIFVTIYITAIQCFQQKRQRWRHCVKGRNFMQSPIAEIFRRRTGNGVSIENVITSNYVKVPYFTQWDWRRLHRAFNSILSAVGPFVPNKQMNFSSHNSLSFLWCTFLFNIKTSISLSNSCSCLCILRVHCYLVCFWHLTCVW